LYAEHTFIYLMIYLFSDLFNLSISTCKVPVMWKCARVTPLYKSSDALDLNNYRPISIIINVVKLFEKIIFKRQFKCIEFSSSFSLSTED